MLVFRRICIVIIALCLNNNSVAQSIGFGFPLTNHYTTDEYGGGIQNQEFIIDRRGVLFVANNLGLLEFDGRNWKLYPVKNGTKVRSLAIGPEGRIYTGSQGDFGYFFPNDKGELEYISLADSLAPEYRNFDETWKVHIQDNKIWFCTIENIYAYENESFEIYEFGGQLEFTFKLNNRLIVTDKVRGISEIKEGRLVALPQGDSFAGFVVSAMIPVQKDRVIITTRRNGVFTYDAGRVSRLSIKFPGEIDDLQINTAIRLNSGHIALGTQSHGILIIDLDGNSVQQFTKGKGLQGRTILSMYQDESSNLWIGLNNGISYLELGSPFSLVNEDLGLYGTGYASSRHGNKIVLGTNIGAFAMDHDPSNFLSEFEIIEGTEGQVYSFSKIDDKLIIGHHEGAFEFGDNQIRKFSENPGVWLYKNLGDSRSQILEGTYTGINVYEKRDEDWYPIYSIPGLSESSRVIEIDNQNRIWMTHGYKGAYKIDSTPGGKETITLYNSRNGFPSNTLINVFKIAGDLIFTSEQGIYRYDDNRDTFVPDEAFAKILGPDIQIREMEEDPFGNIYYLSSDRMGVLKKGMHGEYEDDHTIFNKIVHLLNDDLENITYLDSDHVMIGAKEGFINYNPNLVKSLPASFNVLIRKIEITATSDSLIFGGNFVSNNELSVSQTDADFLTLPYRLNSLRFSFSAPFFDGNNYIQYKYFLEGFDENWSDWSTKNEKEYTNIPEGDYTFHVTSRNIYEVESSSSSYTFEVLPPWYRSSLAYLAYFVAVGSLMAFGFTLMEKKHRKEKKFIESENRKKLTIKDDEIKDISERKEEEITKLRTEKLRAELDHKNRELASYTMHLLNKNQIMNGIKINLNNLINNKSNINSDRQLRKMINSLDKQIDDEKDWKNFEFHFDEVHGDFTNRIRSEYKNLTPKELNLCAYLRLNLNTKEIAHLLNISVRGVEVSRYRLRKKLNLSKDENLSEFILNY